jgi:hypothetical protein
MPASDDTLSVPFCQLLGARNVLGLHASRLSQLDSALDCEHGLTAASADVNVNWSVIVAVEEEAETVFLEDCGHSAGFCFRM